MPMDIKQFLQTFIEESTEMLQSTEQTLLNLDINAIDQESINSVFRSMHSLKGSSAVFGFNAVSELAHTLESFLDHVRSGKQKLSQENIDLLLKAVDHFRKVITNVQNTSPLDDSSIKKLNADFKEKLSHLETANTQENVMTTAEKILTTNTEEVSIGWHITFKPDKNILQKGSEPLHVFKALAELGKLEVRVDKNHLPEFPNFDPTECYLSWEITLYTDIAKKDIQEIFTWIANEEQIVITPLDSSEKIKTTKKIDESPSSSISAQTTSIRVTTEKIDSLINMTGELVITQSMLNQITKNFDMSRLNKLNESLALLEHDSRELQASVMRIRMVPIEFIFNRFPRMVYDLAKKMGKQIDLILAGEQTELDKNMTEKLNDPLLHLVRNALDHGIETPEQRKKKGKPPIGVVRLSAYQESSRLVVEVTDDGAGLDKEKIRTKAITMGLINEQEELSDQKLFRLIFQPGFSTNDTVSDISGRGVGLDVVYKNIDELGGEIDVDSEEGVGTTFRLYLPLTLVIMDSQLVKIGNEIFIIPLMAISEIIKIENTELNWVDKQNTVYHLRDEYIPIVLLQHIFSIPSQSNDFKSKFLIVAEINNQLTGFVVDEVLSQQQVVIKNLEDNYQKIMGISGATILGDGRVALVIDVKSAANLVLNPNKIAEKNTAYSTNYSEFPEKNPDESFQFLSFRLAEQEYGIDILDVKEIRMWEQETLLPNSPAYINGVINVRGTIIPIVDLCNLFDLPHSEYGAQTAIIILLVKSNSKQRCIGIIVDQVLDTHTVKYGEVNPLPESSQFALKDHIRGLVTMNNKMTTLLNTTNFITIANKQETVL